MAAPTFVGAGAGVTIASGSGACTRAGTTAGNTIILQVCQDGTAASAVTLSAITNLENLADTAAALTTLAAAQPVGSPTSALQHLYIGRSLGGTVSVTVATTGDDLYYRLYEFSGALAGTTLAAVTESIANGVGTGTTVSDTGVITTGADRLALQCVAVNDDLAVGSFTGTTGGVWAEAVPEFASATGTDGCIQLQAGVVTDTGVWGTGTIGQTNVHGVGGTLEMVAQSFASGAGGAVSSVMVAVEKTGSPADSLLVEIQTNAAGFPSGTVVGTATIPAASIVPTATGLGQSPVFVGLSATLTAATTYWLVWSRTGARNTSNAYLFATSGSSSAYASGGRAERNSGAWGTFVADHWFAVSYGAAGTINGGTFTMASGGWGVVGLALLPAVAAPATLERSAGIGATGLVATVGRETLARTAALLAVGAVTAAGVKVTPSVTYERSAAVAATAGIATVGRELLPRAAVVAATGQVQAAGVRIRVITRTAAVAATGLIATVGREQLSRAAALSATASIATVGRELLARAAAIGATGSIAAAGREQLARLVEFGALARVTASGVVEGPAAVTHSRSAALSATGAIATVGREQLSRAAALNAAGAIVVAGRRTVARSAAVAASATVSAAAELEGAQARAAAVAATAAITSSSQRVLNRSTTIAATTAIVTQSQRRLERTGQLHALALVEVFTGAKLGEASFDAIATITLTRALPPGWIDFPGVGPITQPIGGLGTVYGGGRILTSGHGSLAQPRRGGPPE